MRAVFVAVSLTLMFVASPGWTAGWRTYVNERFGSTAEVPADWRPGRPPENGDGLSFMSPDNAATLSVSGGLQTFDTVDEAMQIIEQPGPGETITYRRRTATMLVVSGTRGATIFYRKSILTCDRQIWNTVSIEYPAARKREFDALVTRVAGSLRGGRGWQSENCR